MHIDEAILLSYLNGDADTSVREQVALWLAQSDANKKELDQLRFVWEKSNMLIDLPFDVDAAWEKLESRIDAVPQKKGRNISLYHYFAAAAAVLVLILLSYFVFDSMDSDQIIIQTAANEIITDTLPDGSIITLNENTQIVFAPTFNTENRNLELSGEAYFDVQRNEQLPFKIIAGDAEVKVLGTCFNLNSKAREGVLLNVDRGKVSFGSVDDNAEKLIVRKGQDALLPKGGSKAREVETELDDSQFWRNQRLVFRNANLEEVLRKIAKLYHIQIEFNLDELSGLNINARFEDESARDILEIICITHDLKLNEIGANSYEIFK